jgi:hypothetical protein
MKNLFNFSHREKIVPTSLKAFSSKERREKKKERKKRKEKKEKT